MSSRQGDEGVHETSSGFFHRSLSPNSFERLRAENSDYFYKPKRGPSTSKHNITITRPIKTFETVTKLMELLSKGNQIKIPEKKNVEDIESPPLSKKFDDQKSASHYSSFLSMDGADLSTSSSSSSTTNSSVFSSRSNSSISTVAEQETQVIIIDEPILQTNLSSSKIESNKIVLNDETPKIYTKSPCRTPAMGLNITTTNIHIVLLELYPQNIDYSTIIFQRYLISLIIDNEHKNWSILNVNLETIIDQEGNFRLFTLTHEQFDIILLRLETFIRYNSLLASSFILNIALTGEKTNDYEKKISSHLNKINLNFDIIQYQAESYMIGLDFFLRKQNQEDEEEDFIDILNPDKNKIKHDIYPYILVHAEVTSTFFYIVHSPTKYSVVTSNNLSYKTYSNLIQLLQPGFNIKNEECQINSSYLSSSSYTIRRSQPISFDCTRQDLCQNSHRTSNISTSQIPLTSFTRLSQQYIPHDYSISTKPYYIYRGWSNRRTLSSNKDLCTHDVHTQTDDSYLELSSIETRLAMRRSLLSMFIMNIALIIKLIYKLYPSINCCMLTGEFFQLEKQSGYDLMIFLQSILGEHIPYICQLKREPLISAFGCALPRVYFDIINDENILGNDCIS